MKKALQVLAATLLLAAASLSAHQARAVDTVTVGTVGSASANLWPVFIGIRKGFFEAENASGGGTCTIPSVSTGIPVSSGTR